jgi:hypothetical protein
LNSPGFSSGLFHSGGRVEPFPLPRDNLTRATLNRENDDGCQPLFRPRRNRVVGDPDGFGAARPDRVDDVGRLSGRRVLFQMARDGAEWWVWSASKSVRRAPNFLPRRPGDTTRTQPAGWISSQSPGAFQRLTREARQRMGHAGTSGTGSVGRGLLGLGLRGGRDLLSEGATPLQDCGTTSTP